MTPIPPGSEIRITYETTLVVKDDYSVQVPKPPDGSNTWSLWHVDIDPGYAETADDSGYSGTEVFVWVRTGEARS